MALSTLGFTGRFIWWFCCSDNSILAHALHQAVSIYRSPLSMIFPAVRPTRRQFYSPTRGFAARVNSDSVLRWYRTGVRWFFLTQPMRPASTVHSRWHSLRASARVNNLEIDIYEDRPMNTLSDNAERFCRGVVAYYGDSATRLMSQPDQERERLQLAAVQYRFRQLREAIPMVKKLADNEGIQDINGVEDIIPLLFDHSMYKSYPPSMLFEGRFVPLTKWLSKLTSVDLSGFDASRYQYVWIRLGNDTSELRPDDAIGLSHAGQRVSALKQSFVRRVVFVGQVNSRGIGAPGRGSPAVSVPIYMSPL